MTAWIAQPDDERGQTGSGSGQASTLRIVDPSPTIDLPAAQDAVRALLTALGQDGDTDHLSRTPQRVAAYFADMLTPADFELTTFANDEHYDELVLARDIPFASLCEHHLLPFHGVAHVGYLPQDRIVGLSKLARVVEGLAHALQVQERLTQQIATCLQTHLNPKGVGVVLQAEHQCMTLRGVRARGSVTFTSALHGHLRTDPAARQEFLSLTR